MWKDVVMQQMNHALLGQKAAGSSIRKKGFFFFLTKKIQEKLKRNKSKILRLERNKREKKKKLSNIGKRN